MYSNLRKTLENNLQIIKPVIDEINEIKSFPNDTTKMTPLIKYIKNLPPIHYSLVDDNLHVLKEVSPMLEIPEEPKLRNTINDSYFGNSRLTINNNTSLTNLNLYFLYNTEKKEPRKIDINSRTSKSFKKKEPTDTIFKKKYLLTKKNLKNRNNEELNKTPKEKRHFSKGNKSKKINSSSPKNNISFLARINRDIFLKNKKDSEIKLRILEKKDLIFEKGNRSIKKINYINIENKNKIVEKDNKNIKKINNINIENKSKLEEKKYKEQQQINKTNEKNIKNDKNVINKEKDKINISNQKNIMVNVEPRGHLILSEFIKLKQIGKGTFGKIFSVKWKKNNKKYALKKETFTNPEFIEKRKSIVKIINNFLEKTQSNGVINIFSSLFQKNQKEYNYYEIMEIGERDWEQEIDIRRRKGLYYSEKEIFNIAKQLVKTLSLLQKHHITHRDIKHQNILIVNGIYKLCDFGELRIMKGNGSVVQRIRGSELFMSPILFYGLRADLIQVKHNTYKSDVFSLGMCLLYAATMHFNGTDEIREMIDMNQIKLTLEKYLKDRYSKKFISLLCLMLETNEELRPDFEQLENKLDNLLIV